MLQKRCIWLVLLLVFLAACTLPAEDVVDEQEDVQDQFEPLLEPTQKDAQKQEQKTSEAYDSSDTLTLTATHSTYDATCSMQLPQGWTKNTTRYATNPSGERIFLDIIHNRGLPSSTLGYYLDYDPLTRIISISEDTTKNTFTHEYEIYYVNITTPFKDIQHTFIQENMACIAFLRVLDLDTYDSIREQFYDAVDTIKITGSTPLGNEGKQKVSMPLGGTFEELAGSTELLISYRPSETVLRTGEHYRIENNDPFAPKSVLVHVNASAIVSIMYDGPVLTGLNESNEINIYPVYYITNDYSLRKGYSLFDMTSKIPLGGVNATELYLPELPAYIKQGSGMHYKISLTSPGNAVISVSEP
jgi:hypothetical protein